MNILRGQLLLCKSYYVQVIVKKNNNKLLACQEIKT